jgi:hypothetical protein
MDTSPGFYKKSTITLLVLLLISLGVLAKFVIKGFSKKTTDSRKEVVLLPEERDLVLSEMRILLKSLADISNDLSQNDFAAIGITAKATGMARLESLPKEIAKKLPPELLNMAVEVHKGFDELADMVKDSKDSQMVNKKIGQITQSCVACHAIYKISAEE